MSDSTGVAPAVQPQKSGGNKQVGGYLTKIEEVPKEIRDYAINKLSPTAPDGQRLKDGAGKDISASVSTAKENGSYYGPVVLNNDKYLVQAVGKEKLYAIVHDKESITFKGSSLAALDAKKQLNGASVQIHYTGDKAQVYPYSDKTKQTAGPGREAAERSRPAPAREAMKAEDLMAKAADYAKQNIKNANQREAFMKHLGNVAREAFQPKQVESTRAPARSVPAPAHDIQR